MILNNPFFRKLLDTKEPYYKELRNIATPFSDSYYKDCEKAINKRADIPEKTLVFLNEDMLPIINFCSSMLLPFIGLTSRIFIEHPEAFMEGQSNKTLKKVAFTYSDLFNALKELPTESAEIVILKISSDSSVTSKLVSAYRNDDSETFCDTLYSTKADYSNYLYRVFHLSFFYDLVNSGYQVIKGAIEDNISLPEDEINGISIMTNVIHTVSDTPLDDEEERQLTHRTEVLFSLVTSLDNEDTFIDDIIKNAEIEGVEELSTIVWWGVKTFTFISCGLYSVLREGMTKVEHDIYEDFFMLQPSNYLEYFDEILQSVQEDVVQTGVDDNEEKTDSDEPVFLPYNFFNCEYRTTDKDSVGIIEDKYLSKGVSAYCTMINFLADGKYIDADIETKRNFAFKLSGYHKEYDKGEIHWNGDTNILSVIIQKICNSYDKWDRAKRMFKLDTTLYNSSTLRRKIASDKDFAQLSSQVYEVDLYK
jgi:hypothetical protein